MRLIRLAVILAVVLAALAAEVKQATSYRRCGAVLPVLASA